MFPGPLIFIRHGETEWNREGRYQGTTDTALSSQGVIQAYTNAKLILNLIADGVLDQNQLKIVTSPLQRAAQTASLIAEGIHLQSAIESNVDFRELSAGRWQGLTSQQVKERYYDERKSRKSDRWNFKPLGGESMSGRAPELREAASQLFPHCIVITHSVVIKTLLYVLGRWDKCAITHTSVPHVGLWLWDGLEMKLISA